MNANDESDLGKINLLEYIKTLKEHYLEMQKKISRLEKENLELRALVGGKDIAVAELIKKAEKYKQGE